MNLSRNETENLIWDSLDALLDEIDEVVREGAEIVPVGDIEKYINAQLKTIITNAHLKKIKKCMEATND